MFDQLKKIQQLKKQMATERVTGEAANGLIKVELDGTQEIIDISIDNSLLNEENREKLQKELKNAINYGRKQIMKQIAEKMQGGDLDLPEM